MTTDNRKRALSEVASLDAWHDPLVASGRRAKLFVDVAFSEGRIGEETSSPVRFRLRMRRAKVVVIIPPNEPASVIKSSVSRDAPVESIHITESKTDKLERRVNANAAMKVNPQRAAFDLGASGSAGLASTAERATKISRSTSSMQVTQVVDIEGNYTWEIAPATDRVLAGRPWVAEKKPRLAFKDDRKDSSRGIPPVIRVELRCRREDLEITDLTYKDKRIVKALKSDIFRRNKLIAAEAAIKARLFEAGLIAGDISEPFSELVISAILAEPA